MGQLPVVKTDVVVVDGGIAFTFDTRDQVIPGLYTAGETQGEFFYFNYPGATSCLRGCVFGRIAGRHAAASVRDR